LSILSFDVKRKSGKMDKATSFMNEAISRLTTVFYLAQRYPRLGYSIIIPHKRTSFHFFLSIEHSFQRLLFYPQWRSIAAAAVVVSNGPARLSLGMVLPIYA
jgi:hypothetical protein